MVIAPIIAYLRAQNNRFSEKNAASAIFAPCLFGQSNNMYLNAPLLPDTILTWWFAGILLLLLYTVCLQVYEMAALPVKEWSAVKAFARLRGIFTRKRKAAAGQVLTNSKTDEQEK